MTIRFVFEHGGGSRSVEYGAGPTTMLPRIGESVWSDGSDPEFPAGVWKVKHVTHHVTLRRGPWLAVVALVLLHGDASRDIQRDPEDQTTDDLDTWPEDRAASREKDQRG